MGQLRGSGTNEVSQFGYRATDGVINFKERLKYRLKLEDANIAELYLQGRLGVIVTFNTTLSGNIVENLSHPGTIYHLLTKLHFKGLAIWKFDFDLSNFGKGNDWGKDFMLVSDIESVQAIQDTSFPTFKSFNAEKEFLRISSGCFYSITQGFITGLRSCEREGCLAVLCAAIPLHQFPHGMIKGRSKVMNAIPNHQSNIGRIVIADVIINELSARIRIYADNKSCIVALSKPIDSFLDILEVRIGPFDLDDGIVKHGELDHEEETEGQEGCGDPHSEAGRLLQESEESRHATTGQRNHEVGSQTAKG